jgi:hypothetical protein
MFANALAESYAPFIDKSNSSVETLELVVKCALGTTGRPFTILF